MLEATGYATSVHHFQSLHDMHAAWLRQLLYCSKYLCSPLYACVIRGAYYRSTDACNDPDFAGFCFCLFVAYLALLHSPRGLCGSYYPINLCHKCYHCTPDYMVAMYMYTYMYVVQQFHVSETICYNPCLHQFYRYKCHTIELYIEQKMVCGAEFWAETHALCSRVKSRNMQFPEHYPHMPSQHYVGTD